MLQAFAAGRGSCLATARTQLKEELTQLALHLGLKFWPVNCQTV